MDVVFDDHRVWSFHVLRDTETQVWPGRLGWPWPTPLRRYLDGVTRLVVRDAATKDVFFDDEIAFGEGRERMRVVNQLGLQLGIDKSGQRLVPTFSTRDRDDISSLLDADQQVLEALRTAGAKPFVGLRHPPRSRPGGRRPRPRLRRGHRLRQRLHGDPSTWSASPSGSSAS